MLSRVKLGELLSGAVEGDVALFVLQSAQAKELTASLRARRDWSQRIARQSSETALAQQTCPGISCQLPALMTWLLAAAATCTKDSETCLGRQLCQRAS